MAWPAKVLRAFWRAMARLGATCALLAVLAWALLGARPQPTQDRFVGNECRAGSMRRGPAPRSIPPGCPVQEQ